MNQVKTIGVLLGLSAGLMFLPEGAFAKKSVQPHPKAMAQKKDRVRIKQAREMISLLSLLDGFESRHGYKLEFEEKKSAWLRALERDISPICDAHAYAEHDVCMVAGWQGIFRGGYCKIPNDTQARVLNTGLLNVLNCGEANQIACNPEIFGRVQPPVIADTSATDAKLEELGYSVPTTPPAARSAPVCVSKRESRMTLACLRASMIAGGVRVSEAAKKDLSQFKPEEASNDDLWGWMSFLESAGSSQNLSTNRLNLLKSIRALCGHLEGASEWIFETADKDDLPVARASEVATELAKSDPARRADIRDCKRVQSAILKSNQAEVPSPPKTVTDGTDPKSGQSTPATGSDGTPAKQPESSGSQTGN